MRDEVIFNFIRNRNNVICFFLKIEDKKFIILSLNLLVSLGGFNTLCIVIIKLKSK